MMIVGQERFEMELKKKKKNYLVMNEIDMKGRVRE